jgi:excinuclease ABC subunit C
MTDLDALKAKALAMPSTPGVYLMKDADGRVIYVGKAKILPKRVSAYFQKHPDSMKTARLVARVHDVDCLVTDTEQDALILENNLIKKHRPKYNVVLRDDKTYPSLRLSVQEPYPRLEVVRRIARDGAMYFGPFSSASAMRQTLRTIKTLFPLRQCRNLKPQQRPCLNYQLGRCLGVCAGKADPAAYRAVVDEVILFFKGKNKALTDALRQRMKDAAGRLDFETAAKYRDRLAAIERTLERQHVVSTAHQDLDVFGLAQDRGQTAAVVMFVRRGALLGRKVVSLDAGDAAEPEILAQLLIQYYSADRLIPPFILTPVEVNDHDLIQDWLREMRGKSVKLLTPARGEKREMIDLARENAVNALEEKRRAADLAGDALIDLKTRLHLPEAPRRIECFDMSNLRGEAAVGAMVVLEEGRWAKQDYRRYRIKNASGLDDYGMMAEVLQRRLSKDDPPQPDLLLLDGGRGQLSVVQAVIKDLGVTDPPPLAGLAKGRNGEADKVWLPGRKNPVDFKPGAPGLLLLMRIRDEAHRYVQDYHHRLRARQAAQSALDEIPGVGPARRKALLQHFGAINKIKKASLEDLSQVKGLPQKAAQAVYDHFHAAD